MSYLTQKELIEKLSKTYGKQTPTTEEILGKLSNSERLRNCKWCQKVFQDDDDFCSPECLENYASEFLKKKKLPI